jgi:hypothetical protein
VRESQTPDGGYVRETWDANGYVRETWGQTGQAYVQDDGQAYDQRDYYDRGPPIDDRGPGVYPPDYRYDAGYANGYGAYGAYPSGYVDCPCDCPPPVPRETVQLRGWGPISAPYGDYYGGGGGGVVMGGGLAVGAGAGASRGYSSSASSASSMSSAYSRSSSSSSAHVTTTVHIGGGGDYSSGGSGCLSCQAGGHGGW